jgi:hypothetical protein
MQNEIDAMNETVARVFTRAIQDRCNAINTNAEIARQARERIQQEQQELDNYNTNWKDARTMIERIYLEDGKVLDFNLWRVLWLDAYGYQHDEEWQREMDG